MRWLSESDAATGIRERSFVVSAGGHEVPGVLWLPEPCDGPRPLVLAGHGATLHKRVDYIVSLAHLLVRRHGFACASLDAPGHGDRRPDPDADEIQRFSDFLTDWSRPGTTDLVIAEWQAALDALRLIDEVGDGPLAYWGLSMGTIYGLPFVAGEARVQAAVFGLMGLLGPTRDRLDADARSLTCPVLFIQQWDDQLVPRDEALELFDTIASVDKRLHAHPGQHAAVPGEELVFSVEFLARHLRPAHTSWSERTSLT